MLRTPTIAGKVMRAPSLDRYDLMGAKTSTSPKQATSDPVVVPYGDSVRFDKDASRTHARDKALLVALGVDGDVPLMQARMNAGLPLIAANDNQLISAAIAA